MLHGVSIKELSLIPDERGYLMEILRNDDPCFTGFGQVYLSVVYPGVVKAWHSHRHQSDNACCLRGAIKMVLFDDRPDSPTRGQIQEIHLCERRPRLVHVPKGLHHGWKGVGPEPAWILNTVDQPYDYDNPDEQRLDPHDNDHIPYDWSRRDG